MPYYPVEEVEGNKYETYTFWDKLVADYSNLSIIEVQNLDWIDYLILRHDAFISKLNQTESGIQYLNNAWRLEYGFKPDRNKLHELIRKGVKKEDGK